MNVMLFVLPERVPSLALVFEQVRLREDMVRRSYHIHLRYFVTTRSGLSLSDLKSWTFC